MKINFLILICFANILNACTSTKYNMLDGKSKPVYFTPDSTVFNTADKEIYSLYYNDLSIARMNFTNGIDIADNNTIKTVISKPTFFNVKSYSGLIYPGESVIISKGEYNEFLMTDAKGNATRNKELQFFKIFSTISYYPPFLNYPSWPIDSVLQLEKHWLSEIPSVKIREQKKFDSLANALQVSPKFKKLTADYLFGKYELGMLFFYNIYKDSLSAHGLYKDKIRETMKFCNNISDPALFENVKVSFNENVADMLPFKIRNVSTQAQFEAVFDSSLHLFSGVASEALLTQLMYQAYKINLPIDKEYEKKYYQIVKVQEYTSLISKFKKQKYSNSTGGKAKPDMLLQPDGKKKISFEDLLARYKGKIIVLDIWAHWCAPCHDDLPAWKQRVTEYKDSNVVFLRLSIDREIQPWQKNILSDGTDRNKNFVFFRSGNDTFLKTYQVDAIPRYMLLDKEGSIINADLPRPGEEAMAKIINESLRK